MKEQVLALVIAFVATSWQASADDLVLWYKQPANPAKWEEAVPLGNGRLGAMVFGGIAKETIILNEDTLWSGWPEPNNDREGSYDALIKIRKLLKENGDKNKIKKLVLDDFCSLYGYGKPDFGAYQSFCNAHFEFGHKSAEVKDYRRELNLENAVATVRYTFKGVDYKREYFCSYPDNVMIIRLTANKPGMVNCSLLSIGMHFE